MNSVTSPIPIAEARFDDGQPRCLIDVETGEAHTKPVWFIESEENAKIPGKARFKITLRSDGLGLSAQPDEETWEMMKHRGGKRLIETAARAACQSFALSSGKTPKSKVIKLELAPKGQKLRSPNRDGTEDGDFDAVVGTPTALNHIAKVLTGGSVWLPPAPTTRIRGWAGPKD